jgi:hypothetical protein
MIGGCRLLQIKGIFSPSVQGEGIFLQVLIDNLLQGTPYLDKEPLMK